MRRTGPLLWAVGMITLVFCVNGCTAAGGGESSGADLCDESTNTPTVTDAASRPLAFTSDRSGSLDLWLMGTDGSNPIQLTTGPGLEAMASWSPDGTRILFVSAVSQDSQSDICVVNADGTGMQNLTDTPDAAEAAPNWSPNGTSIVYGRWSGDVSQIHRMDVDGGRNQLISANGEWPSWSPNGKQIVFVAKRGTPGPELWVMNADGGDQAILTESDGEPTEPSWSPDGDAIAFVAPSGDSHASDPVQWNEDIFVMPAEGGPARQIVTSKGNDHWPPAWSPDGTQLAYTADGTENRGTIMVVDRETLEVTKLTDGESHDMYPAWRH